MQRERTALKVMLQLLVEGRDHLKLGQLVPLGDLWDAINAGDEPLTEVMRAQFAQARRLWVRRFQPMLLREHDLSEDDAGKVAPSHPYVTDARLVKSLLVAALVPEVGPLRALTVSRLTALNSGIVRAFIPGTERQQVLDKLRRWAAEVGELRLGEDEQDPTVSVVLSGIDTGPILEAARVVDSDGERLTGARSYTLRFDELPPVDAFWSLTMYDGEYFFVPNPLNRYTLSSRFKFNYNKDGSLDLYIQKDSPGKDKEANWLPAPAGTFILMLRLYWPREKPPSIIGGTWKPPAVKRVS